MQKVSRCTMAGAIGALLLVVDVLASPHYGPWSRAVNLGVPVNTPYAEMNAHLSKDGTSLYFSSNRPCGLDDAVLDHNLWVAHRRAPDGVWESAVCLDINVNPTLPGTQAFEDSAPVLSRDQHWLYFVSDRPGSSGVPGFFGRDIWASWRSDVHDDQAWAAPFPVGAPINTSAAEAGPAYFQDDNGTEYLFFTTTRSGLPGLFDIWVAEIANGLAVGPARRVDDVNTDAFVEAGTSIRRDGLELFFFRGVPGGVFDLYSATRPDTESPWSEVQPLAGLINTPSTEQGPSISPDRETLLFVSNRPGSILGPNGQPSSDIWISARSKNP